MGKFTLINHNETGATWEWKGEFGPHKQALGPSPTQGTRITIPPAELRLDAEVTATSTISELVGPMQPPAMHVEVADEQGTRLCSQSKRCFLKLDALERAPWMLEVANVDSDPPTNPFRVTLKITKHVPWNPQAKAYHPGGDSAASRLEADPRVYATGLDTSEPTIGATRSGALFTNGEQRSVPGTNNNGVLRSTDGGVSWDYVAVPSRGEDFDPWVWVDPTTSRIFRLALQLVCSTVATSDDDGRTWKLHDGPGCGLPGGHYQKLTTGPPPNGVKTEGYPSIAYYSSSLIGDYLTGGTIIGDTAGVWVSTSLDGGATWGLGAMAHPGRRECAGWGGPVVVAPDGTAFSPAQYCDGIRIAVSKDAGATWQEDALLTDMGHLKGFLGPSMAIDTTGRAYVVYPADDGRVVLRWRNPQGEWSQAVDVTPPGVKLGTFTVMDAGEPGRIAIALFGTESDPTTWPQIRGLDAPPETTWHLFIVLSENALAANPTFTSYQLTPPDDPIQRGCIDQQGSQVTTCRNLTDFMDMTLTEGLPVVSFPDGCLRCADSDSSEDRKLGIAIVEGFRLLDPVK